MRRFHAPELPVGTLVRMGSSGWYGVVVANVGAYKSKHYVRDKNHIVQVCVTHDRRGRPLRKPMLHPHTFTTTYFEVLTPEQWRAEVLDPLEGEPSSLVSSVLSSRRAK